MMIPEGPGRQFCISCGAMCFDPTKDREWIRCIGCEQIQERKYRGIAPCKLGPRTKGMAQHRKSVRDGLDRSIMHTFLTQHPYGVHVSAHDGYVSFSTAERIVYV